MEVGGRQVERRRDRLGAVPETEVETRLSISDSSTNVRWERDDRREYGEGALGRGGGNDRVGVGRWGWNVRL